MHRSCLVVGAALIVAACGGRTASTGGNDEDSGGSTESSEDAGTAEESGSESETGDESAEVCGDGVVDPGEDCEPEEGDPLCNDDCTLRGSLQHEVELGQYSPVRVGAGSTSAYLAGVTDDGITVASVSLEDGSVQWHVEGVEATTSNDVPLDVLVTPDDELLVLTTTEAAQLGPDERTTVIHYDGGGAEVGRVDPAEGQWLNALAWGDGVVAVGDNGLVARVELGPLSLDVLAMMGDGNFVDVAGVGDDFVAVGGTEFVHFDGAAEPIDLFSDPNLGTYVSVNATDAGTVVVVSVRDGVIPESTLAERQADGTQEWSMLMDSYGLDGEVFRVQDERTIAGRTFADFSGLGMSLRRMTLDDAPIWTVEEQMDGFVYQDAALGPEDQVVVGGASGLRIYRP